MISLLSLSMPLEQVVPMEDLVAVGPVANQRLITVILLMSPEQPELAVRR